MAKRKRGIITTEDYFNHFENGKNVAKNAKRKLNGLTPCRVSPTTVLMLRQDQNKDEQIQRYMRRLEQDRSNY